MSESAASERAEGKRRRISTARDQLGEEEWVARLGRLMGLAVDFGIEIDSEQAQEALNRFNGHVGKAVDYLQPDRSSGAESDRSSSGGASDCGEALCETLDKEWWNNRFREDGAGHSDWLLDYERYGTFLTRHLSKSARTLVLGCGNSPFSAELHAAGFRDIVNMDISDYVIEAMREKHAAQNGAYCEGMTWEVDDATAMKFGDGTFEQIVDKSLLDCMTYCDEEQDRGCIPKMLRECFRVLKPGGLMVMATKQHITVLHEHIGGVDNELRWCGLDWRVDAQQVFVPQTQVDGRNEPGTMVATREELPEADYFCMYIYCARKLVRAEDFRPESRPDGTEWQPQQLLLLQQPPVPPQENQTQCQPQCPSLEGSASRLRVCPAAGKRRHTPRRSLP